MCRKAFPFIYVNTKSSHGVWFHERQNFSEIFSNAFREHFNRKLIRLQWFCVNWSFHENIQIREVFRGRFRISWDLARWRWGLSFKSKFDVNLLIFSLSFHSDSESKLIFLSSSFMSASIGKYSIHCSMIHCKYNIYISIQFKQISINTTNST